MNKLSKYATTIAGDGQTTHVTYHSTVIVEWDNSTVTLRTGGWDTVTTRRKMNQASRQFGLGFQVYAKDFASYVILPDGSTIDLERKMTFARAARP
jgi:hypothetical protein